MWEGRERTSEATTRTRTKRKWEVKCANVLTSSYELHAGRHTVSLRAIFNCSRLRRLSPQSVHYSDACHGSSALACVSHRGGRCCRGWGGEACGIAWALKRAPSSGLSVSPSLLWRPDSPIRTEWGGICLTLAKDLSQPLTAMAARHSSLLMRTLQPPPPAAAAATAITSPPLAPPLQSIIWSIWDARIFSLSLWLQQQQNESIKRKLSLTVREKNPPRQRVQRRLSDGKELKSTQGNLEIYIQSPSPVVEKPKLHSWHPIF